MSLDYKQKKDAEDNEIDMPPDITLLFENKYNESGTNGSKKTIPEDETFIDNTGYDQIKIGECFFEMFDTRKNSHKPEKKNGKNISPKYPLEIQISPENFEVGGDKISTNEEQKYISKSLKKNINTHKEKKSEPKKKKRFLEYLKFWRYFWPKRD